MKRFLLILVLFATLLTVAPVATNAIPLNLDYPEFGGFNLKNLEKGKELETLAKWFYSAIVIISGLAAFVMLVWGGITWMSSAGSPTAISDAKDRIQKALLGLLLVLASFLILQVINPELTVLKIPGVSAPVSAPKPAVPKVPEPKAQLTPSLDVTFTVNNTSDRVTAEPGDSLNLAWAVTNGSPDCKASGASQWTGDKPGMVGSETIILDQEKTYSLSLSCRNRDYLSAPPVQKVVTVVVSSKPVLLGTSPPSVDLKAVHPITGVVFDLPFTLSRTGPKEVTFLWGSTDATQCNAKDELINGLPVVSAPAGSTIVTLPNRPALGDHRYTIRCTNQGGLSAEDSVVITIQ